MNSAIDVSKTSFGTAETHGNFATGIFGKACSLQTTSGKISLLELENRLEMLGPKAKKGLMVHIQRSNPKITSEGFVELGMLQEVLEGLFGKASDLLMQQVCPP
jgi:hypothetical protein